VTFEKIETGFPDTVRMAPGEGPDAVLMRAGSALVSPLGKVLAGPVTRPAPRTIIGDAPACFCSSSFCTSSR
jgi:hypothetical protein